MEQSTNQIQRKALTLNKKTILNLSCRSNEGNPEGKTLVLEKTRDPDDPRCVSHGCGSNYEGLCYIFETM